MVLLTDLKLRGLRKQQMLNISLHYVIHLTFHYTILSVDHHSKHHRTSSIDFPKIQMGVK